LRSLSSLLKLATAGGRGPRPSFAESHFLLAFMTIGDSGMIGRQALAREAGIGEGAVRTVLKKLRDGQYAQVNASGCHLTTRGKAAYSLLRRKLSPFVPADNSRFTVGSRQAAIRVKGGARRLGSGIEQRDSAILVGAAGATTYAIKGSKFTIPGGSVDCEKEFPSRAWKLLRKEVAPKDGDAVILCGAEDGITAKLGALSAALTLL